MQGNSVGKLLIPKEIVKRSGLDKVVDNGNDSMNLSNTNVDIIVSKDTDRYEKNSVSSMSLLDNS